MYRPIPTTREHHRNAVSAFQASFVWSAELLGRLFHIRNPTRAATAWLTNYERQRYFSSMSLEVSIIGPPDKTIFSCEPGEPLPDKHKLAYQLERRWTDAPPKRTRIYWPTTQFAECYGGRWLGSRNAPATHKVSHDLLVSAVWLRYFAMSPDVATEAWIPERELEYLHRSGERKGPIPDALIQANERPIAVEIGGQYPANCLLSKLKQCVAAGYRWELW